MRFVVLALLSLVVHSSPVHAQSEADAMASAAAPAASTMPVGRAPIKYADPSIELELEYKVENAVVCVAWPEQLQDGGCEGLDIRNIVANAVAFTTAHSGLLRSVAVLRYGNSTATASVAHAPSTKTYVSQVEIDDFLKGYLWGLNKGVPAILTMSGSTPGSRYDEIEINGIDALHFEVTADVPRGAPGYERSRALGYVFFGKHGQVMIAAATDPQHMPQTRAAIESIVKTVRMPQLAQRGFGKTSALVILLDSPLGLLLLVLVAAGLLSVQSYFWRRKRKERARQR